MSFRAVALPDGRRKVYYNGGRPRVGRSAIRCEGTTPVAMGDEEAVEWFRTTDRCRRAMARAGERTSMRMRDVLSAWLASLEVGSANTARTYASCARRVSRVAGNRRVDEMTRGDMRDLEREIRERGGADGGPVSASTALLDMRVVSSACSWMVERGWLAHNPASGLRVPGSSRHVSPSTYTPGELARMSGALRADGSSWALAVLLIMGTGLRRGEALALVGDDYDPSVPAVTVRATLVEAGGLARKPPKTASSRRTVQVPDSLAGLIPHARRSEPLFPAEGGGFLDPDSVSARFRCLLDELGIDGGPRPLHRLRHTFATILKDHNTDTVTIQRILGHSRASTTLDIYTAPTTAAEVAAVGRMDEIINGQEDR